MSGKNRRRNFIVDQFSVSYGTGRTPRSYEKWPSGKTPEQLGSRKVEQIIQDGEEEYYREEFYAITQKAPSDLLARISAEFTLDTKIDGIESEYRGFLARENIIWRVLMPLGLISYSVGVSYLGFPQNNFLDGLVGITPVLAKAADIAIKVTNVSNSFGSNDYYSNKQKLGPAFVSLLMDTACSAVYFYL